MIGSAPNALLNARLADGSLVDVGLADGAIVSITTSGEGQAAPGDAGGESTVDLEGRLLLSAAAEPHAHLDKALSADDVPNPRGDLGGAIEGWLAHRLTIDVDEIAGRARSAVERSVAAGITAIRTHVDVGDGIGTRAAEALVRVRGEVAGLCDLQIVALVGRPIAGPDGEANRSLLDEVMEMGVDLVGGCPHLDPDPEACLVACLEAANRHGRDVDLHLDENLDPGSVDLGRLAAAVAAGQLDGRATASHCVSLGIQPITLQDEVAAAVAAADVGVVALPQTNLFLQARDIDTAPPRGLTAIAALRRAGALVAGGADNLQDPFNTVGRADPFETASLLVMAGHLPVDVAYDFVSTHARQVMGLDARGIVVGAPAELVAVAASNTREAVASAPADRIVIHEGRIVARTTAVTELATP